MEIGIFVLALLTLCSGFFSASESALFSLSPMRLKAYQTDPNPRRRLIAQLVHHPRDLLVTVFMLNSLVNILLQNVASNLFGVGAGWGLKVGVPLFLTLIFGEIIPKYLGLQNNVALSYYVTPSIYALQRVLRPIQRFIIAVTLPISRFFFFFLKKEKSISPEELQHVLKTSEEHGLLKAQEAELVRGYLDLQVTFVKEVMCPREDMVCFDMGEPLSKLAHLFREKSRIPLIDGAQDHILGILSGKTYFLHQKAIEKNADLIRYVAKPIYVPENILAPTLLRQLDLQNEKLAIVVDEYGTVNGLITREDIVELVVGKFNELRDQSTFYTRISKNELTASGKLELSVFNELFGVDLVSEHNMVTMGGWLTEQMGEIPKAGTKYRTPLFLFQILASDPKRIRRFFARKQVN